MRETWFDPWVGKIPWRRKWQPTPVFLPGESHGRRNLMGYSPWVAKSWTWLMWASLVAKPVKNPPAMQETQVWSLDQEDPLEKWMATHFSVLSWRIPWTEKPSRPQSMGSQGVGHDWATKHTCTCKYMNQFTVCLKLAKYFKSSIVQ